MLCASCGKELPIEALSCPACGTSKSSTPKSSASGSSGPGVMDKVKAAAGDSLQAFKSFALNPVGELANVFNSLGEARALAVGITFGVVAAIGFTLGDVISMHQLPEFARPTGIGWIIKSLLWSCIPFLTTAAACFASRSIFRGAGGLAADCFVAGASMLPIALLFLMYGMLGLTHLQAVGAIAIFMGCIAVFILFVGFVRIMRLSEKTSTFVVPIVILLSAWLSDIIHSALTNSGSQPPTGFSL